MLEIESWTEHFIQVLRETFGERIWFAGLQGSRGRGEESEGSDIDLVVILDELTTGDIRTYDKMLDGLPDRELVCGFLSGKAELFKWEPSDLFQFYYDTRPIVGSLDELLERIDEEAVRRAVRLGVCNIYHGCIHNMLYDRQEEILKGLYKSASFVVQAICFMETGRYIRKQKNLLDIAGEEEQNIVKTFLELKAGGKTEFEEMSDRLLLWAQGWINRL
uniref:nucleotidyltransferase domain-containing protein n=1 Tax=Lachnoclostridium phocaeense TaxID=1871021 RepID=UPI0026DD3F60|nr:nucleotidyltransferase domain-containing protein [Lachnoclostridium phocaeense]